MRVSPLRNTLFRRKKDSEAVLGVWLPAWPLHDIGMANIVWCMAFKTGVEGDSYIAQ